MKSLKVIPLLDSIPKIPSYSNYGVNLEKIFKMSSLKNLIRSLKFKKDYFKQLINESSKIKNGCEEYDVFERQNKIKKDIIEEQKDIFTLPLSKSESKMKIKKSNIRNYFFRKKFINNGFDTNSIAYKYNPNFNSIYKNIPSVKIFKPIFDNNKNNIYEIEIKNNLSINNKNKNNIILNAISSYKKNKTKKENINFRNNSHNLSSNSNNTNNSKSIKNIESNKRFVTEIPIINTKKSKNKKNCSNNNLPNSPPNQKSDEKNSTISENNYKGNITPFHYKNRAIDFTKMRSRKAFITKSPFQIPDFGCYEPKYNLIEKRQYDIFFDKKAKKKIILQKILTSYDVEADYQTIDNNKLNNDILSKYRFLK